MRFKISIASLFVIVLVGCYAFLGLPFFTDNVFYREYILAYRGSIDRGISVILILVGTYIVSLILQKALAHAFAKVMKTNGLAKKIFPLLKRTLSIFLWIVAGIFILTTLGVNIAALLTGAGVGGVFLALAGKEAASNFLGSLSLIFSHNFKIGDTIRVKGYEGTVEEISLSYTRLVNKKVVIFIPNKLIISDAIENLSMEKTKKAV